MAFSSYLKGGKRYKKNGLAWTVNQKGSFTTIWSELSILLNLLNITGISIEETFCDANHLRKRIFKIAGLLQFVASFTFIASEVTYCGFTKFVSISVVLCMSLNLSMTLLLWITMFSSKNSFSYLISRLGQNRQYFSLPTKVWKFTRYTRFALIYIVLIPIITSILSILSLQKEDTHFYLNCYLFGNDSLDDYFYDKISFFFFLTVENYTQFFLPNLVTLLIHLLCEYLAGSIKVYVKYCKSGNIINIKDPHKTSKDVQILKLYKNLKDDFKLMHHLVSFPIFVILSQKFVTLFFTLTVILSKKKVLIQLIESLIFSMNGILSISILIISGLHVREAHNTVREMFLELGLLSEKHKFLCFQENELLLMLKIFVQQEDMILTAAQMVPLTRSLFLKIGAALVTYGVLIVQFNPQS